MKSFLVIGLGAFGGAVAQALYEMGHTVVGVERRRERVEKARDFMSEAVEADAADREAVEQVLQGLGAENVDAAIVGLGRNLEASILACLFLKDLGVKRVVAKVLTADHARILGQIGVDEVLFPEADSGKRLASRIARANLVDFLPVGEGVEVMEVTAPASFAGKSLAELHIRNEYDLLVLAIRRSGSEGVEMMPGGEVRLGAGDVLIVLGQAEGIEKLPKE